MVIINDFPEMEKGSPAKTTEGTMQCVYRSLQICVCAMSLKDIMVAYHIHWHVYRDYGNYENVSKNRHQRV